MACNSMKLEQLPTYRIVFQFSEGKHIAYTLSETPYSLT